MRVFPVVCGFLCAAVVMHAEDTKPADPPEAKAPPATPDEQKGWRYFSSKQLETKVRGLLYDSRFDDLDTIVTELNEKQSRYSGGTWKLPTFFDGVNRPWKTNDPDDWKVLFQRLEEWDQHSHNIFSSNAIGCTKVNYAWLTVAHWQGRSPTDDERKELKEVLASAVETYDRVLRNPQKCVDAYAQLLRLGQLQSWPPEKMEATLRDAIATVPDYYICFDRFAINTLPSWGGKPGDTRRFFDSIPTLVPENKAYQVYTRLGLTMHRFYKDSFFGKDGIAEWAPMKKGFEQLTQRYSKDAVLKNKFAAFAYLAGDRPTARALLDELTAKGDIEYDAWLPMGGFTNAKKWILESP